MKHRTKHHLIPQSRIQRKTDKHKNNIVILPSCFHNAWHAVVVNLTTEEAIEFITIVMQANTSWNNQQLAILREEIKSGVRQAINQERTQSEVRQIRH